MREECSENFGSELIKLCNMYTTESAALYQILRYGLMRSEHGIKK